MSLRTSSRGLPASMRAEGGGVEGHVRRWSRSRPGEVLRTLRPTELRIGGQRVFARASPAHHIYSTDSADSPEAAGLPVVFVHGVGVSSLYFVPTAERVPTRHSVLMADLPGFGKSEKPRHIGTLDDLADEVVAVMDAAAMERALLVGNSFGCVIAARAALRHPDRVAGLLLQGPTGDPSGLSYVASILRGIRDLPREPLALLPVLLRDYWRCGFWRLWQSFRLSEQNHLRPTLEGIRAPTRIVVGARDALVDSGWAELVAAAIPRATLDIIEGAHAANFSHPQALIEAMRPLLGEA